MGRSAWSIGGWILLASCCAEYAVAQQAQQPPGSIYTCIDRHGRKLTADRPIADCVDREQRELNPSGTTRRQVGPTLTEIERAEAEAQRRKEAEVRARAQEERRRERALMMRYPDKEAHDTERLAALQQVEEVSVVARKHLSELLQQRQAMNTEMEFYAKDPSKAPASLRRRMADNEDEARQQQKLLTAQEEEKRKVHQRFDAELAQLRQLWAQQKAAIDAMPR